MQEALAVALLVAVLVAAVVRPRGLPEAVVAVPAALLLLGTGAVSWAAASDELSRLGPVVGFLAAVLALAHACAGEGLFAAVGAAAARRAGGRPQRLLLLTFAAAAATTAVLSLDTTVVLLTPVVFVMVRRVGMSPRPHLYACAHLSNSASLLLPVSNLTNLLALAALPISFGRFTALMALPWLATIAVEYGAFRWFFRGELRVAEAPPPVEDVPVPWFAVAVVGLTLAGFVASSFVAVAPVWVAAVGAAVLLGKRLVQRRESVVAAVRSTAPLFCLFVLALGVVVRGVSDHGVGTLTRHVLPGGSSLPDLLAVAAVAAIAANLLNNLPATLLLLPVAARGGVGPVLAVLIGVDIGPNLTYVGSLATLLWRRVVGRSEVQVPRLKEFTVLGVATVPLAVTLATVALWVSLREMGS